MPSPSLPSRRSRSGSCADGCDAPSDTIYYPPPTLLGRMDPERGVFGGLARVGKERGSLTLFGAAGFLVLLSLVSGWFSVDTSAEVYDYDPAAPQGKGANTVNAYVDVELKALSLATDIKPDIFERAVEQRTEKPSYDEHAGRSGTVMLGVLILSSASLLMVAALFGFLWWHRKGARNAGPVARRIALLFLVFGALTLGYFSIRVSDAAEKDTWVILDEYQPNNFIQTFPELHPDHLRPRIGFWTKWRCCDAPQGVYTTDQGDKLVLVEVASNPSAGYWLFAGAEVTAALGFALGVRHGHFEPKPPPPVPPPEAAAPAPSKVT